MNTAQYIWLAICWVIFGLSHSLLAADNVKKRFSIIMQKAFRFYRLLYSFFAASILAYILYYNFSISSIMLWQAPAIQKIISIIIGTGGIIMMLICINKYFFSLSGFDVFYKKESEVSLKVKGLNACIRHPLYTGTLLFVWGFFFWQPLVANLISSICISIYTFTGTVLEERRLLKIFGEDYKNYVARVPRFFPKLF